jgi:hypothetical protein
VDWEAKLREAEGEHEARAVAPPAAAGERDDLRLAGIAGASWAAGLAALMLGRRSEARALLQRAADEYIVSWDAAPPGSWGRPIAALRCLLMAEADATPLAERVLEEGVREAEGPIAAYCAALALLVLRVDAEAAIVAESLRRREDFSPSAVADALAALAWGSADNYRAALREVLRSFEERDAFLEDVPVADTVLVLDALARARGLDVDPPRSPLLPDPDPTP